MDSAANPGAWLSHGEDEVTTLDISDNPLNNCDGKLDDRLVKFVALRSLRAKRCNLVSGLSWHTVMWRLENLLILDMSGNGIKEAMLEYLPVSVKEVDFSSNEITRLTEFDAEPMIVLPNLVRLVVTKNRLSTLPSTMEVPSLQTLCFGENIIEYLPEDLIRQ